jgi:HTH-type transcriptional regulator / antitoxin HigA
MTNVLQNEYQPDYVSAPGETLLEVLETMSMSQVELAKRMGRPSKTINEIIQGKAAITAETALQLEQVLHIPASFWLKRELQYRESLARVAEEQKLENWKEWLNEIPVQMMMQRGWIPSCTDASMQVAQVLKFFGVASPDAWRAIWESKVVVYRKAAIPKANFGSIAAWLRKGELEAQNIECAPYDANKFRRVLHEIRALTVESVEIFQHELVRLCANSGVAVVFVQELPNTGISGSTQWLTSSKALVQLSLRYKTDDQLWFTFFHEAGHILLHGKRQIFLEIEQKDREKEEREADAFATNILINHTQWQSFMTQKSYRSKADIEKFASQERIAPGIVVGRLQHEKLLPYHHCNDLKRRLAWSEDSVSV